MQTKTVEREILVVDDHQGERESLAGVLQKEGYTVHLAADGVEALRALGEHGIQLVIFGHEMPAIGGFGLIDMVSRRHPHVARIEFVDDPNAEAAGWSTAEGACPLLNTWSRALLKNAVDLAFKALGVEAENRDLVALLNRQISLLRDLSRQLDFRGGEHNPDAAPRMIEDVLFPARGH